MDPWNGEEKEMRGSDPRNQADGRTQTSTDQHCSEGDADQVSSPVRSGGGDERGRIDGDGTDGGGIDTELRELLKQHAGCQRGIGCQLE